MSDPRLISPMLDNFDMGEPISEHDGVRSCPALQKDTDERYIVKVISIPSNPSQLDALLISGAYPDKDAALGYFKMLTDDIVQEAEVLDKLSRLEGFSSFDAYQVEPMEDNAGYDVYLMSKYQMTLQRHHRNHAVTHLEALNLGLDMCAALSICRQIGYLYIDLKPENIILTADQGYKICDIGFARLNSLKYATLPARYQSAYTAPEILDPYASLNTTVDIYALGLILYQIYNGGVLPAANMDGTTADFPAPAYADYEIAEIILKACAANPEERWQNPAEFGQALVSYMQRNGVHNTTIVPSAPEPEQSVADATEDPVGTFETPDNTGSDDQSGPEENSEQLSASPNNDEVLTQDPESEIPHQITDEPSGQSNDDAAENAPNDASTNDSEEVQPVIEESSIFTEDEEGNLTFITDDDETLPTEEDAQIDYAEVSDDVSDMLQQVDDLISHEAPAPVIQPDPIEVTLPVSVANNNENTPANLDHKDASTVGSNECNPDENDSVESDVSSPSTEDAATSAPVDNPSETIPAVSTEEDSKTDKESDTDDQEDPDDEDKNQPKIKSHTSGWLIGILSILLAAGLIVAGIFFFKNYYFQPVDSIVLEENENGILTILVNSNIDENKLTAVCSDTYGNRQTAPVENGRATFTGLAPNAAYAVKIEIKGFHMLTGEYEAAYTTPSQTEVVQLNCVTGAEDGSVILSFTINGPDSDQWRVSYTDTSGAFKETEFPGHTVTLTGLEVGSNYKFTVSPVKELQIIGITETEHTAAKIIRPADLRIDSCVNGKLNVSWATPADATVESWTVRCYNDNGFDETKVVSECTTAFDIKNAADSYTVEVTAGGMSVSERIFVEQNARSITAELKVSDAGYDITWKSADGQPLEPTGGWNVQYVVNNSYSKDFSCQTPQATIHPIIPGAKAIITIQAADGTNLVGNVIYHTTRIPEPFEGYAVSADLMEFNMCKAPSYSGWDHYDVPASSYRTQFEVGEKAAFVIRMRAEYNTSDDEITTTFVIRNDAGEIVDASISTDLWWKMWRKNYCELEIPSIPQVPGNYTISVYFNGDLANETSFTVVAN